MNDIIENMRGIMAIPVFFILLIVIRQAIKENNIFPGPFDWVISISVSLICVMSMLDIKGLRPNTSSETAVETPVDTTPDQTEQKEVEFILLPYATLGITLILLFILALLIRAWRIMKRNRRLAELNRSGDIKTSEKKNQLRLDQSDRQRNDLKSERIKR